MLKLRLRRTGQRNQPYYRLVVAEHTAPITGKFVAMVGHYNPRTKELVVNQEEVTRWLAQGAQASNTVARLLTRSGMKHDKLAIHTFPERPSKKAAKAEDAAPAEAKADVGSATPEPEAGAEEASAAPEQPKEESAEKAAATEAEASDPVEETPATDESSDS